MFIRNRPQDLSATRSENSYFRDYSLNKLQGLAEGNINFTIEMLQIFLQNADKDISELKASCLYNNWERVGTLAHKLIPACEYLQLDKLARFLKDIEINSNNVQDRIKLVQLVDHACDTYSQIRPMIIIDLHKLKKDKVLGNY